MSRVLSVAIMGALLLAGGAGAQGKEKIFPCAFVDLIVVFDRSGSMGTPDKDRLVQKGIVNFATRYRGLSRANGLQIGLGAFRMTPTTLAPLTDSVDALNSAFLHFERAWGNTSIAAGFSVAQEILEDQLDDPSQDHRKTAKKIVVLFTDGRSSDLEDARMVANDLATGAWARSWNESIPVHIYVVLTPGGSSLSDFPLNGGAEWRGDYSGVEGILEKLNLCG